MTRKYTVKLKRSPDFVMNLLFAFIGGLIVCATVNSCGHEKNNLHNEPTAFIQLK